MVHEEKMETTLRVAGGWVRDKLVGQQQTSHQRKLSMVNKMDIDIALDNCMGGDFATKLNSFMVKVCFFLCVVCCVCVYILPILLLALTFFSFFFFAPVMFRRISLLFI